MVEHVIKVVVEDSGFKYAKLTLDEPRAIYYAGQVLNGNIFIELSRPLEISVVNANYIGEGKVFWTEDEFEEYNGVRRNIKVKYQAYETYFNVIQCVAGGTGIPTTIPPGVHNIPFQFQIPHIAPSSFEGERGSVNYKVIAYVEFPNPAIERYQLEQAFEVVAPFDLNKEDIKRPLNIEFEEFYSCCCSSSPMNITINLPHHGFCPGQTIPITIKVHNESNQEVKKIVLQLIKKVCFHSKEPKSDYIPPDEVLQTVKTKPILGNSKREVTYNMVVPDMITPNLQNCSIIDVGFFIKVTIELPGCNDDLEDESEICLGLIPIAATVENEPYKHPMQNDLPQGPIPDPSAAPAVISPPIQNNTAYPISAMPNQGNAPQYIQNTTAYPVASSYPAPGGPYPNVTAYPPNPYQQGPKPAGFVIPETPPGSYGNAPYQPTAPFPNNEDLPTYTFSNSSSTHVTLKTGAVGDSVSISFSSQRFS